MKVDDHYIKEKTWKPNDQVYSPSNTKVYSLLSRITTLADKTFNLLNPAPAELFQIIFLSFKAGIANAISSFKWRKIFIFMKNKHLSNWNIWLAEHLPLNILSISLAFCLGWNLLENVDIRVQQDKG